MFMSDNEKLKMFFVCCCQVKWSNVWHLNIHLLHQLTPDKLSFKFYNLFQLTLTLVPEM